MMIMALESQTADPFTPPSLPWKRCEKNVHREDGISHGVTWARKNLGADM